MKESRSKKGGIEKGTNGADKKNYLNPNYTAKEYFNKHFFG